MLPQTRNRIVICVLLLRTEGANKSFPARNHCWRFDPASNLRIVPDLLDCECKHFWDLYVEHNSYF